MALSATEIDAILEEIRPALTGAWVQKVHQPTPSAIVLEVRAHGRTVRLLLLADPGASRLHVLNARLPNPQHPPPFCQYLRAHIQGGRIDALERIENDRLVRIRLSTKKGPCSLLAMLIGKRADLLLLDQDDRIMMSLHHGQQTRGVLFVPPPPPTAFPPKREDGPPLQGDPGSRFPVSDAIDRRFREREEEEDRARLRRSRMAQARRAIKKTGRRAEALQADLEKAQRYQQYSRYGELLKTNLRQIVKGQDRVTVIDYFDPACPELVLPLDPAKGPQGNMDDFFKKHRKYLAAERELRPRSQQAERELQALKATLRALEQGVEAPSTSLLALRRAPPRASAKEKQARARSVPFRRFLSSDGRQIYIGRNARENEELTHKFARSEDLWLHARGVPGSHVVVRLEKNEDPPPDTVRDAATLALLYSDLKKSGKGEVIYTRRKWVRKVKGQAPGAVTVTREQSIFIYLDKTRLEAIKQRSSEAIP